jgi:hypothetical protein
LELWLESYADTEEGGRFIREVNEIITPGMTDEEVAEQYLLKQARRISALFEEAHRRPARTTEELYAWVDSPECKQWIALDIDDPTTWQDMHGHGHR